MRIYIACTKLNSLNPKSGYIKPNLDCYYNIPIDKAPNGISIGVKSIGKLYLQSELSLIEPDSESIYMRHAYKSILNLILSNLNRIVITAFRLI